MMTPIQKQRPASPRLRTALARIHGSLRLGLCALVAGVVAVCGAADRGVPASHGIVNFGKVDEHLYRGAQPDAAGVANLKQLGVTTIINLRTAGELWPLESATAAGNSILYTNIPLKGVGRPEDRDIARVLDVIEHAPGPVFVHCEHGCDRTGTVVACYRIKHDGWDARAVFQEADHYGMSSLEHGMRSYVADFARRAAKKPAPNR